MELRAHDLSFYVHKCTTNSPLFTYLTSTIQLFFPLTLPTSRWVPTGTHWDIFFFFFCQASKNLSIAIITLTTHTGKHHVSSVSLKQSTTISYFLCFFSFFSFFFFSFLARFLSLRRRFFSRFLAECSTRATTSAISCASASTTPETREPLRPLGLW